LNFIFRPPSLGLERAAQNVALGQRSINSNLRLSHDALGAILEALVLVLQSHPKRPSNQRGAFCGPISYPPVLVALKPILTAEKEQLA
jgi:hypothetical protein